MALRKASILILLLLCAVCMIPSALAQRPGVWDARMQYSQQRSTQSPSRSSRGSRSRSGSSRDKTETIVSDGVQRSFYVHVPPSYTREKALPVVFALHGAGMNIESMRALTFLEVTADRNGFIAVFPQGVQGGWNCGGHKIRSSANDTKFFAEMIDYLRANYNIDPKAVFVTGISNGGLMAERLACDLSDKVAAIGVVSITGFGSVCRGARVRRAVPAVFFLGTDDPLCPWENGEAKQLGKLGTSLGLGDFAVSAAMAKYVDVMSAEEIVEFWAQMNGCSSDARNERLPNSDPKDGCDVVKQTYGAGNREVICYTVNGGGHSWPGGLGFVIEDKLGRTCMDISASDLLWQFFRNHRMN